MSLRDVAFNVPGRERESNSTFVKYINTNVINTSTDGFAKGPGSLKFTLPLGTNKPSTKESNLVLYKSGRMDRPPRAKQLSPS